MITMATVKQAEDVKASTVSVKIPPRFYADHLDRGCGESGRIIRQTKTYYLVELDSEAYKDLYSDCEYYIDMKGELDSYYKGLVASARTTLKALQSVGSPP